MDQGKFVFLCSNSHYKFLELSMRTTLGEDWRNFFHMVFCAAGKPKFFTTTKPLYIMDSTQDNYKGAEITDSAQLTEDPEVIYMEGNGTIVMNYLKAKL